MPESPPYMNAYGLIYKILEKIKEAQTPDRFTQDFLGTKLNYSSGSAKAFIPFAKRIGLLSSDGSPTKIYKQFRNPNHSGTAIAQALKKGYADLFSRNEYANELSENDLMGLILEATGLEKGNKKAKAICKSFQALNSFADFDKDQADSDDNGDSEEENNDSGQERDQKNDGLKLGLNYTFNLVLPDTNDISVFNAIFKALRETLLKK